MGRVWGTALFGGVAAICIVPAGASASPWGRAPDEKFGIARLDYYVSEEGEHRFEQLSLETYAEGGLTGNWSQGSKFIHVWQNVEDDLTSDYRSGLAEAEIYLQRQIWEHGSQRGALQLLYSFETSKRSALFGTNTDDRPAAIELAGLWGVGNDIAFFATRTGYRASLGEDADQLRFDATAGFHIDENSMALIDIYSRVAVGAADEDGIEYDLVTLAPSLVVRMSPHIRVQIGARTDIHAQGLDKGTGGFLALWIEP